MIIIFSFYYKFLFKCFDFVVDFQCAASTHELIFSIFKKKTFKFC